MGTTYLQSEWIVPQNGAAGTAVPFWGQTTCNLSETPPNRDCSPKRVSSDTLVVRSGLEIRLFEVQDMAPGPQGRQYGQKWLAEI